MKRGMLILVFSIALFIIGCSSKDITAEKVFNEFSVDKAIAEQQYSKLSNSDKEDVDKCILEDMNTIYKSFENKDLSLSEAFTNLNYYKGIEAISNELENLKDKMTIISESENNYKKAEEELTKDITYITLENAIDFYKKVDPASEYHLDSRNKIESLNNDLLNLSKDNKIPNIVDKDLLEFFQSTNPINIIREYYIGMVKEKYIYDDGRYLVFKNEILIDEGN
ncbi:hypothetical protein SDC9_51973 [bioreactor metagenome]|uniref:Lipoprotein n=1 Tax=bioreactor metagenome TaxID=1076179 RepID=A0A644WPL1_9ZZZZ